MHGGLYRTVEMSGAVASRLATEMDRLERFPRGKYNCAADSGRYEVIVFAYGNRADVDIWYHSDGCPGLDNSYVERGFRGLAYVNFEKDFERIAPGARVVCTAGFAPDSRDMDCP